MSTVPTASQRYQDTVAQLNSALLTKDQLQEQLDQTVERVKALRNLLAGVELGRQVMNEIAASQKAAGVEFVPAAADGS